MKYVYVIFFIIAFSFIASAQKMPLEKVLENTRQEPGIKAMEVKGHIGEDVYVVDTIYSAKLQSEKIMYLYVGKNNLMSELTIIVKGTDKDLKMVRKNWVGGMIHVSGKVVLLDNKPVIIVTDSNQFGIRIQI
jgi:hypothetical protein